MANIAQTNATVSFGLQSAIGIGTQLDRALHGDRSRVHFLRGNKTLVQFDGSISESYNQDAAPTSFPIEDGSSINDHIIVAPRELQITGVVSDTPFGSQQALLSEGITQAVNALAGPFGVTAGATAYAAIRAQQKTKSRSTSALETMLLLAAGNPDAKVPTPPEPFDVVTQLRSYSNMVIKSLQVPRDATTGAALVFNVALVQMRLVVPKQVSLQLQKAPEVSQAKEKKPQSRFSASKTLFKAMNDTDVATFSVFGQAPRYPQ